MVRDVNLVATGSRFNSRYEFFLLKLLPANAGTVKYLEGRHGGVVMDMNLVATGSRFNSGGPILFCCFLRSSLGNIYYCCAGQCWHTKVF